MIFAVNFILWWTLLPLLTKSVYSSALFKCPEFESEILPGREEEERGNTETLIIPAHLMSHLEPTKFSLEATTKDFPCNMNPVVININLIETNNNNAVVPIPINTTTEQLIVDFYGGPENLNLNDSVSGEESAAARTNNERHSGGSGSEGLFAYSIDNNNNSSVEEEEEIIIPDPARKLSRREIQFTPAGFLFYSDEYYRPSEFCISSVNEVEGRLGLRKCDIGCNDVSTPCIPLCCHLHEYIDLSRPCCSCSAVVGSPQPIFQPVIYEDINRRLSLDETIDSANLGYYYNSSSADADARAGGVVVKPHYTTFPFQSVCPDGFEPQPLFFNEDGETRMNLRVHIQNTGKVAYIATQREWLYLEKFCVAGIINGEEEAEWEEMRGMTTFMRYCLDEEEESHSSQSVLWPYYAYIGSFSFSSIFLLLTTAVYLILWEKQNIHGWTVLSFVVSEFFLFLFLSVATALSIFGYSNTLSNSLYCVASGLFAHFFFLSTFCWLTIVNVDLWLTFKNLTPLSERSKGTKRFCLYMLFAWGIPATTIITGIVLQHVYTDNSSEVVVPHYGNKTCFLATNARGVYLYYIIGALLLVNLVLITFTFYTIYQFKKSTRVASSSSSKSKERSFKLFLKLVIIMGATWILELAGWIHGIGEAIPWYYVLIDIFNILQGIGMFFIFVMKRKILNQLEQKHPSLRVITRPLLRLMAERSVTLTSSTESKPTRSTTLSSSIMLGSRKRSQKSTVSADCRV